MTVHRIDAASLPAPSAALRVMPARRRAASRAVIAFATVAALAILTVGPSGAGASPVDPLGDELMRVTNVDRVALGKPALAIDPTLAAFARDLAWTCPTNTSLVLRGRAADMAARGYFSHQVPACLAPDGTDMSVLEVLSQVLGYRSLRGENIAWNNYGTEPAAYAYGCSLDGTGCGGTTPTSKTVEVAQQGFMTSAGHRANILNSFDRFGCGSSLASNGRRYYACVFSLGGPPANPTPAPTPTPTVGPDRVAPLFVRFTGTSTVRAGYARTVGATVSDDRGLARLEVRIDGRLARRWSLSGSRAVRAVVISASWLRVGRHQVRWVARDASGNVRTRAYWLYVR